jgi:Aspartyl/Asparaginyl beta-hydroxylase
MSYFPGQVKTLARIDLNAIEAVLKKLDKESHLWGKWDALKPNRFNVFDNSVQHIVFRYPVNLNNHQTSMTFPVWHDWQPLLQPIVDQAAAKYNYKQGSTARIMLARLLPDSTIPMHIDASPSAKIPHKVHIPLQTSQNIVMKFSDDLHHHLAVGNAYEVNNRIEHGVINPTSHDRVHLIFDYFA